MTPLAAAELRLQRLQEILRLLVVDLDVEVARHPEGVLTDHAHLREDLGRVAHDQVLDLHERAAGALVRHANQARQHRGDLHDAEGGIGRVQPLLEDDADVDALVPHVRERVHRVDGDRRQHREDLASEVLVEARLLLRVELLRLHERHAGVAEALTDLVPDPVVLGHELVRAERDGPELLLRGHAVGRELGDVAGELRLEPRRAHHEEFVQIAGEDREELQPLVERDPVVRGLREHAR